MIGPLVGLLAVVEIVVFVVVAHATSWLFAIVLTLVTSACGLVLVPRTASRAFRDARRSRAGDPVAGLADAAVGVLGCALLVLPGFVTDAVGILMVLRPTRAAIRRLVGRRIADRFVRSRVVTVWPAGRGPAARGRSADGHEVIEGEVVHRRVQDDRDGPDTTTPRRPG